MELVHNNRRDETTMLHYSDFQTFGDHQMDSLMIVKGIKHGMTEHLRSISCVVINLTSSCSVIEVERSVIICMMGCVESVLFTPSLGRVRRPCRGLEKFFQPVLQRCYGCSFDAQEIVHTGHGRNLVLSVLFQTTSLAKKKKNGHYDYA